MRLASPLVGVVLSLSLSVACSQDAEQRDDTGLSLQFLDSFMNSCEAEVGPKMYDWCLCVYSGMGGIVGTDDFDDLMLASLEEDGSDEADAILEDALYGAFVACKDLWDEDAVPTTRQ